MDEVISIRFRELASAFLRELEHRRREWCIAELHNRMSEVIQIALLAGWCDTAWTFYQALEELDSMHIGLIYA